MYIFSRWLVLPFPRKIANPDPLLPVRLFTPEALSGFLRVAVEALRRVMERGSLNSPASVRRSTAHFRREANPMHSFIDERIRSHHPDNSNMLQRNELYAEYKMWCAVNGMQAMSAIRFYESFMMTAVEALEYPVRQVRRNYGRFVSGISIHK